MRKRDILRRLKKFQDDNQVAFVMDQCLCCDKEPTFVVYDPRTPNKQAFICTEHLGPFISVWTTAPQISVVKL